MTGEPDVAHGEDVYRRYFIKSDGSFVGAFEGLYRHCEDPWDQTREAGRAPFKHLIILGIQELAERRVLDIGSGNGAYTQRMRVEAAADVIGVEVSPTAVAQARSRYPLCRFEVASATEVGRFAEWKPAAICMCGLTWCILDSFVEVLKVMKCSFPGALLFHTLTFYPPGKQKYGTEYFTNLKELLPYFSAMHVLETFEHRVYTDDESVNTLVIARI